MDGTVDQRLEGGAPVEQPWRSRPAVWTLHQVEVDAENQGLGSARRLPHGAGYTKMCFPYQSGGWGKLSI